MFNARTSSNRVNQPRRQSINLSLLPRELQQQVFETYHRGLMDRSSVRRSGRIRVRGARVRYSRGAQGYSRARTRRLVN